MRGRRTRAEQRDRVSAAGKVKEIAISHVLLPFWLKAFGVVSREEGGQVKCSTFFKYHTLVQTHIG